MTGLTVDVIRAVMDAQGFAFFTEGAYNVNLIGLRNSAAFDVEEYNDLICAIYRERADGPLKLRSWRGTTDPGVRARKRASKRTAVLKPGQYRGAYTPGEHKGRRALVQQGTGSMTVFRVGPDDLWPFADCAVETGWLGINFHDMLNARSVVSEGCQGCHDPKDHNEVLDIVDEAVKRYGRFVTYTLLDWA